MNAQDLAVYKQAQELANSGQLPVAYQMFRSLRERADDIEILFGIVTTTPNPEEAEQVIETIRNLQPYHPMLPQLQALHSRKMQRIYASGAVTPVLLCPYCGNRAPALIRSKLATAGWVVLLILLFTTVILFWIGFFFQEKYYVCSRCGSKIADAN